MIDSKSTDKLELLLVAIKNIPVEKIMQVKSFSLSWERIGFQTCNDRVVSNGMVVPFVKIEF